MPAPDNCKLAEEHDDLLFKGNGRPPLVTTLDEIANAYKVIKRLGYLVAALAVTHTVQNQLNLNESDKQTKNIEALRDLAAENNEIAQDSKEIAQDNKNTLEKKVVPAVRKAKVIAVPVPVKKHPDPEPNHDRRWWQ